MPNWFLEEKNGVQYYAAWNLHASGMVAHGFSTRVGGVGKPPFDTLNLSLNVNDDPSDVLENRRRFAAALGVDAQNIAVPVQTHSRNVMRVDESHAGRGALSQDDAIADVDAFITNTPGLTLALHFADCVPVFILDPVKRAIAMVHAGWRGTALKISAAAVDAMISEFGTDPLDLQAAVGPSIGRFCYEIDNDAAEQLFAAFPHDERVLAQCSATKWRADLKTANAIALESAGMQPANIAISDKCTWTEQGEFFSYRRDGETGRMSGWITLL